VWDSTRATVLAAGSVSPSGSASARSARASASRWALWAKVSASGGLRSSHTCPRGTTGSSDRPGRPLDPRVPARTRPSPRARRGRRHDD